MSGRYPIDDPLMRVDSRWMGWGGPIRYVTIIVGVGVAIGVLFVRGAIGLPVDGFTAALLVAVVAGITNRLTKSITYDKPVRALISTFWDEANGPRKNTKSVAATTVLRPPARFR